MPKPKKPKAYPHPTKGKKLPPEPLTRDEVHALLKACSRRGPSGARMKALLVVLWRAGLRISEALALEPRDLDPEGGTVNVRRGKGHKARIVPMDPQGFDALEVWLGKRERLGIGPRSPVFCTVSKHSKGQPMSAAYVRAALKRLGEKAGLTKRIHAHGLRHTLAAEMNGEGFALTDIQLQLGHTRPSTTDAYLRRVRPQRLIEGVRKRTW